ncbi:MAG: hypothetical protein DSZ23_00950 [Thermodesulfatator sp.]|nr:MAG: hypothetical protein DSZ23_00950 [Thermodesulfatator sp.]
MGVSQENGIFLPSRVGVLINPRAERNRTQAPGLEKIARRHFELVKQVVTPMEVRVALWEFARQNVDQIVISGGDGTIQAALTVIFRDRPFHVPPVLAVLPGGTTNLIAKDVGIPGSQIRALNLLGEMICQGIKKVSCRLVKRPVMRVTLSGQKDEYGMFAGGAGICQAVDFFSSRLRKKGFGGKAGIIISALKFLWMAFFHRNAQAKSEIIRVKLDKRIKARQDFVLITATTLERLFFGLRPFDPASKGPIHFTAVAKRPRHLLKVLLRLLAGRTAGPTFTPANGYYMQNVERVELFTDTGVALDGQILRPLSPEAPIIIECGGYLNFCQLGE